MIWYDMIWYDVRHNSDNDPSISINIWHMLSGNWPVHVWTPASPHTSLNPWECGCSTFLPQEEQVRRQAGVRPCTCSSLQLRMGTTSLEFSIQNIDHVHTCTHLPLRLTNPLRVRKLHFPLSGEADARAGRFTAHMLIQFNLIVVSIIYEYFFMQIENYTEHWLLHVRVPTCPHAQPIPWECGCSTFLPWERPAPRQAGTQPCSSSEY